MTLLSPQILYSQLPLHSPLPLHLSMRIPHPDLHLLLGSSLSKITLPLHSLCLHLHLQSLCLHRPLYSSLNATHFSSSPLLQSSLPAFIRAFMFTNGNRRNHPPPYLSLPLLLSWSIRKTYMEKLTAGKVGARYSDLGSQAVDILTSS